MEPQRAHLGGARRWPRRRGAVDGERRRLATSPARPGAGPATRTKARRRSDALGSTAYDDNAGGTGELIAGCHRSKSAEVYIGGGVSGENLACSGAKTSSFTEGETFKPGIDFYNSGGKEGQALMLQHFAATHNVKLVAVSIGGNNFNFAGIVQTCVEDFLESTSF